jgi:glycerol-3-phosphate dehydrogenase
MEQTDVVIIGGGCVAAGIARDLSMRKIPCILLMQKDPAYGFISRCSGVLESGALHAVADPVAAREFYFENRIISRIAESFVEETDGLLVLLPGDDLEYISQLLQTLRQLGIPARRLSARKAMDKEPALAPEVIEAIAVPDATVNPYTLALANAHSASEHGAQLWIDCTVLAMLVEEGEVKGVHTRCQRTGEEIDIRARCVINAASANVSAIAAMAGIPLPLGFSKLSFVLTESRLTRGVVRRCQLPSLKGEVIVPSECQTILRTAPMEMLNLDHVAASPEEVDRIIEQAGQMVPSARETRAIRAFATIQTFLEIRRPSIPPAAYRGIVILDHGVKDGVRGFYTVLGGKLTTYRRAAQLASDAVCRRLGVSAECTTHRETLPKMEDLSTKATAGRMPSVTPFAQAPKPGDEIVCQCKKIYSSEIENSLVSPGPFGLGDIQHLTGAGIGSCQGGVCSTRILSILADKGMLPEDKSNKALREFLEERWKGVFPVAWGDCLREEELIRAIVMETFNLDHSK